MLKKSLLITLLLALFAPWAANAQQALPYSYGFEDNDLSVDGWTTTASSSSSGITTASNAVHSGDAAFVFYYSDEDSYLISPVLTGGTNGVDLSFYYKAYDASYPDHFRVGYTTDESVTDPSGFTYGEQITSSTSWQEYTAPLPAGTVRVAVWYDEDNYADGWYLYLDDFSFTAYSPYPKPTDLTVDAVTNTTATLSWTENGTATQWQICLNDDETSPIMATTNPFTLTGLTAGTDYTAKVRAYISASAQSNWSNPQPFLTNFCADENMCNIVYELTDGWGDGWTGNAIQVVDNATSVVIATLTVPDGSSATGSLPVCDGRDIDFVWVNGSYPDECSWVIYAADGTVISNEDDGSTFSNGDLIATYTVNCPSCLAPTDLIASDITTTAATLSWTAGGAETAWVLQYGTSNDFSTYTEVNVSANPTTPLSSLTSGTTHYVRVKADCGSGDESAWSAVCSFNTECEAMPLPYLEPFDSDLSICWNLINTNTYYCNINIQLDALTFYNTSSSATLAAVLPEIDAAYPLNECQIKFDACYANSSYTSMTEGKLRIGIMTDPTDFTTFELVQEVDITDEYSTFGTHKVKFNNYTGTGQYIAIQDYYTQAGFVLVDNIEVKPIPDCWEPEDLEVSNITTTSATLSWTAGSTETAWDIYVTDNSSDVPDDTSTPTYANVTSNTDYPITGLTSAKTYYVYVRAICAIDEYSDWSLPFDFNTECEGMPLPFDTDFQSGLSMCWTLINTNASNNVGVYHNGSSYFLGFNSGTSSAATLAAVLPEVDAAYPLNEYQITFDASYYNASNGKLRIGIMTDPTDFTTFELVKEVDIIDNFTTFGSYKVRFNNYTGTGQYIAIQDYYTTTGYVFVDNILVDHLPNCIEVDDLAVSNVTNHTAQLDWTGTSDAYNIEYWTAAYLDPVFSEGFEDGIGDWTLVNTASSTGINSTPYSGSKSFRFSYNTTPPQYLISPELTGVTTDLTLEFYYKNYSSSYPETFMIGTSTVAATTAEDIEADFAFEAEITASDTKWHLYSTTIPAGTKYICWKYTSNNMFYLYIDDIVIGSPVAAGAPEQIQVNTNTKILTDLLAERKYEARVQSDCGSEGTSLWSDIVSFTTEIACAAPTGLSYSNVKSSEAEISWNSEADEWLLNYKVASDDSFSKLPLTSSDVIVDGNLITYTLTGLTPETEYVVKVCNDCGVDGTSEFTPTITFTTTAACPVPYNLDASNILHESATITWNGESDDYVVQYRTAASINGLSEDFGSSPTDWTFTTGALNTGGTATLSGTSSWSRGTNCGVFDSHIYMNMYGTKNYWLITPSLEVGDGYLLSMDIAYTKYSSGSTNTAPVTGCTTHRFAILISTDDKATWTILREWNNSGSAYVLDEVSQNGQSTGNIDLSAYAGQNAYIAFFGHSETSSYDNNFHFDNVTIGTPVPAGAWTTAEHTLETSQLNGLTAGTKYEVRVQGICGGTATDWSDLLSFTTVADNVKVFVTEGEWGEAGNWDGGMPSLTDNVVLQQNATIGSGTVATANAINLGGKTLTIADGGQLQTNANVTATVQKHITGYDAANVNTNNGYYLIANPLYSTLYSDDIESSGLLTGTYDLYNWSPSYDEPWRNYKSSSFSLYTNTGYLYANQDDVDLSFTGTVRANNSSVSKSVNYSTTSDFGTWTLVGNPFVCDAYLVNASTEGTALPYYKMNTAGNGFTAVASGAIAPMEGVFYQAESSGYIYLIRTAPAVTTVGGGNLNISLSQVVTSRDACPDTDNAIVRFDDGQQLGKFSFRDNAAKIYIPQDGKDYAVVNAEAQGELPVNFKAATNGSYTLSFNNENVEFGYLHLIDNMTGADVDLLDTPSYTFDARTTDYASRFRLVYAAGSQTDDFAFISNGEIILNGIIGNAIVQVFDVTGRMINSVNGANRITTNGMAAGVYVLRLINGDSVKTQKIVVK